MSDGEVLLVVDPDGTVSGLYTELVDLLALGRLRVERASHVEFNPERQEWEVRLPDGTCLAAHPSREAALAREVALLQEELLHERLLHGPRLDGPRLDEPRLQEPRLQEPPLPPRSLQAPLPPEDDTRDR